MTLKIAVVGTGGVAERNYLPYIAERDDIQLSYLNRTRSKAEAVAEQFGGRVAADAADLMADDPDTCLVFTKETDRLDAANALLPHGPKRLFFEKPLAARHGQANVVEEDFFDARAMMQASHGAGVETAMVFNYRFFDQTRLAREIVERRRLGSRCISRVWCTTTAGATASTCCCTSWGRQPVSVRRRPRQARAPMNRAT